MSNEGHDWPQRKEKIQVKLTSIAKHKIFGDVF